MLPIDRGRLVLSRRDCPIEKRAATGTIRVTVIQGTAAYRAIIHKTLAAIGTFRFTDGIQRAAYRALKALDHINLYAKAVQSL